MTGQGFPVREYDAFPLFRQHMVIGHLAAGRPIHRRAPAETGQYAVLPFSTYAELHERSRCPAPPHLGQAREGYVARIAIGRTYLGQRKRQVPVQLYAAVCHGIVTVENEHGKTIPGGPWGVNTNHPRIPF